MAALILKRKHASPPTLILRRAPAASLEGGFGVAPIGTTLVHPSRLASLAPQGEDGGVGPFSPAKDRATPPTLILRRSPAASLEGWSGVAPIGTMLVHPSRLASLAPQGEDGGVGPFSPAKDRATPPDLILRRSPAASLEGGFGVAPIGTMLVHPSRLASLAPQGEDGRVGRVPLSNLSAIPPTLILRRSPAASLEGWPGWCRSAPAAGNLRGPLPRVPHGEDCRSGPAP
jgi:hypothetical protein